MKSRFKTIGTFFAQLLTRALLNPSSAEAHSPQEREMRGIIQGIDLQTRTLTVQSPNHSQPAALAFKCDTKFIKDWRFSDSAGPEERITSLSYCRATFAGKPFVTKVV